MFVDIHLQTIEGIFAFAVSRRTMQYCSNISASVHLDLEGLCRHKASMHCTRLFITSSSTAPIDTLGVITYCFIEASITNGVVTYVILNRMRFFNNTSTSPMGTLVIIISGFRLGLIKDREVACAILQWT
uniref:Uncharacterized protein n=1 Tax=Arundo donax TaxID=35708 RepID=A0A0A9HF87_ARUDO